ncbi:MAG: hypothetical protein J6I76_00490 [Oribacterium sp.]|nr:hypothetical protein [Oribacterium sp.]
MREFVHIKSEIKKIKNVETAIIYPSYSVNGKDVMRKGGDFYAVLNQETGFWETDEGAAIHHIDEKLKKYADEKYGPESGYNTIVKYLDDSTTGKLKEYNLWMSNLPKNHNYIPLDSEITFMDEKVTPEMYRSKTLPYVPAEQPIDCYDRLMSVLYSEDDRKKIEWLVGSILCRESKNIEKALVIYGKPGSGKSTVLDIIEELVSGYWKEFIADDLARGTNQFATALFKDNPLVAIQDDGKLTKIESPIINEIISHKRIVVNEKCKRQYSIRSNAVLILATNDPVDIHDTKLGIVRRLLDVYPSGKTFDVEEYERLKEGVKFEIPGIAFRCMQVYKECGRNYYTGYRPNRMIHLTNYIQNFMYDELDKIEAYINGNKGYAKKEVLYDMFKAYCEKGGLAYPQKIIVFAEEIKEYFEKSVPSKWINGKNQRNLYEGLKVWKILGISEEEYKARIEGKVVDDSSGYVVEKEEPVKESTDRDWLTFSNHETCTFDEMFKDCVAQYATSEGSPIKKWKNVTTKLSDIDTHKLHWLKLPNYIIKMDFDKKDKDGNKSLEANIEAASKFPKTYAEVSKSGNGIHLYYIYSGGDPSELSNVYDKDIEIKKSTGDMSHRRMLTKWNNLPISMISTGLPFKKGGTKVVDEKIAITEKGLRTTIKRSLAKEVHPDTRSNIDWIYKILNDAYKSGLVYDVSDMHQDVLIFAMNSTHQSEYCVNKVGEMKFASEEAGEYVDEGYDDKDPIIFFDFEVFPNLNLLCWKYDNPDDKTVQAVFNPSPEYIAGFFGFNNDKNNKVIGFNNKEYDNHIAYDIYLGKTPYEVFCTSQGIINKEKDAKHREAKHLSYSDLFDFLPNKMSLKKWEIKLGIDHQEFSHKWDEPIPENLWPELAEYCKNDVLATEAVFHSKDGQAAWKGRRILCDLASILMGPGSTVNDSTNDLTTKLIVGNEKNPQRDFVYPNLAEEFPGYEFSKYGIDESRYISKDVKISGKSFYKGYDPGEGGFVWAKPGMYGRAVCFDVASMHPSSIIAENGFGPYTENFKRLLDLRLHIKHKDYDAVRSMYNGALAKYLESDEDAKALSFALKIAINSVYGLTAAKFPNRLRDSRNIDNWVAKRGALFMIDLMLKVQEMGGTVIHCKTDSIKVLDPSEKVANYIISRGKEFGYNFEIEHIFDRICLVNDAVYVCKYTDDPENEDMAGKWDATGKQYQVPYVFKTIFSHEPIVFDDMCETKSTSSALYLDFNEGLSEGEHNYQFIGKTGRFTPVVDGSGGGELYRDAGNDKYARVEGTTKPKEKGKKPKGYRWHESVTMKDNEELKQKIDYSYYNVLVDKAIDNMSRFGDVELFASGEPMPADEPVPDFMQIPDTDAEELPFL